MAGTSTASAFRGVFLYGHKNGNPWVKDNHCVAKSTKHVRRSKTLRVSKKLHYQGSGVWA
jgi:hypothetical protein